MKDIITYINENNYNKNYCIVCCANDAVQDTLNKDKDFMHYRLNRKDGQEIFVVPIKNEKVRKILKWGSILVYKIPLSSEVNIIQEGNGLIIEITSGASGNVTIYVNGKSHSVPINDGQAVLSNILSIEVFP